MAWSTFSIFTPNHVFLKSGAAQGVILFVSGVGLVRRILFFRTYSRNMVKKTKKTIDFYRKEHGLDCETHYFVSDAFDLSFPDGF